MASKSFFKVDTGLKRPTQQQIELARRKALSKVQRGVNRKLDAKAIEAMLRMVIGYFGDLRSQLEADHRKVEHKLETKFAQGVKQAKSKVIKINQDIRHLEDMGYDAADSGIDYRDLVNRLRKVGKTDHAAALSLSSLDVKKKSRTESEAQPAEAPSKTGTLTPAQRTAFETPVVPIVITVIGLLISFIDMLLLSGALEKLLQTDQLNASIYAFFFAMVGTFSAILWGRSKGVNKNKRLYAIPEFWVWLFIGLVFIAIRAVVVYLDVRDFPDEALATISSESMMMVFLTILYTGTGLVVKHEAQKIFDPTMYKEWRNMRAAKGVQNKIADRYSEAERLIVELERFKNNYRSLGRQYVIKKNNLKDAERNTLSTVVKRVLEDNTYLRPRVVADILRSILNERKEEERKDEARA